MSATATTECILQIVRFRCIDLWSEGLYRLTVAVHAGSAQASLYCIKPGSEPETEEASVNENDTYRSGPFSLKYSNESKSLGDTCYFRVAIEASAALDSEPLTVSIGLSISQQSRFYSATGSQLPVSSAVMKVNSPLRGVHEFYRATFDEEIFATADLLVHTYVGGWVFQPAFAQSLSPADLPVAEGAIEKVCRDFIQPHVRHLEDLQTSMATLRLRIPNFDYRYLRSIRQNIAVSPQEIASNNLCQVYFVYFYENALHCSPEVVTEWVKYIMKDLVTGYIAELQNLLCTLMNDEALTVVDFYREIFEEKTECKYDAVIVKEPKVVDSVPLKQVEKLDDMATTHKHVAMAKRSSDAIPVGLTSVVDAKKPRVELDEMPIFFKEYYQLQRSSNSQPAPPLLNGTHLLVFLHGYGGSSADLRLLANFVARRYPENAFFLTPRSIEGMTEGDILEMGKMVALEIDVYIREFCAGTVGRVSFIGYSLGGLIARAALRHLEHLKDKMNTFLTLSTPHLGVMHSSSSLVDAATWIFKAFKSSMSIKQMSLSDKSDISQSALFILSQHPGLRWFRRVILFSSAQDNYSPIESSRIELSKRAEKSMSKRDAFVHMAASLMSDLSPDRVIRVDVDFPLSGVSIDGLIGRKAHIEFITNLQFLEVLCEKFPDAFR